jgi:hypothetical protein
MSANLTYEGRGSRRNRTGGVARRRPGYRREAALGRHRKRVLAVTHRFALASGRQPSTLADLSLVMAN